MPVAPYLSSPPLAVPGEFRTPVPEEAMTFVPRPIPPGRHTAGSEVAPLLAKSIRLALPPPNEPAKRASLSEPVPSLDPFPPFVPVLDLEIEELTETVGAPPPASFVFTSAWEQAFPMEGPAPVPDPVGPALGSLEPVYPDAVNRGDILISPPGVSYRPVGMHPVPSTPRITPLDVVAAPVLARLMLAESARLHG